MAEETGAESAPIYGSSISTYGTLQIALRQLEQLQMTPPQEFDDLEDTSYVFVTIVGPNLIVGCQDGNRRSVIKLGNQINVKDFMEAIQKVVAALNH